MFSKKFLFVLSISALLMFADKTHALEQESSFDNFYLRFGYNTVNIGENDIEGAHKDSTLKVASSPKYDLGLQNVSVAIGKNLDNNFRTEIELGVTDHIDCQNDCALYMASTNDFKIKSVKLATVTLNTYYDFDVNGSKDGVVPYIAGGFGFSRAGIAIENNTAPAGEIYPLSAQFKFGIKTKLLNLFPIYVGYKFSYLMTTKLKISNAAENYTVNPTYSLHGIDIGVIFGN